MADLPTISSRLTDLEITANAPITETLMRRFGSNINFILDFLGVSNGETTPSGALNDLAQAVETASTHTMDLQLSVASGGGSGVRNVGSFTNLKFLNQIFYFRIRNDSGFLFPSTSYDWGKSSNGDLRLGLDGGGKVTMNQVPFGKTFSGGTTTPTRFLDSSEPAYGNTARNNTTDANGNGYSSLRQFSKMLHVGTLQLPALNNGESWLFPIGVVDWRMPVTDFQLDIFLSAAILLGNLSAIEIYREYRLNVGSLGF